MFVTVLYFIFSLVRFSAALPMNFLCKTRKKYGESIFLIIRRTERLTIKYQKIKCDVEFLRLCLIYNLIPKFIRFKLWKPELKTHSHYQQYQRHCILTEYKTCNKDSLKLKKEIESLMNRGVSRYFYRRRCVKSAEEAVFGGDGEVLRISFHNLSVVLYY